MDSGRTSSSLDPTNVVATQAQPAEQPPAELSPWVRVIACLAFTAVAAIFGITIGFFYRVADFYIADNNLDVTDAAGGTVSDFNFYWEPYV
jgi:hypothetical protein